jgi:hypothetical protein
MFDQRRAESEWCFGRLWCRAMHPQVGWPINGKYRCLVCLREYEVPWAQKDESSASQTSLHEQSVQHRAMFPFGLSRRWSGRVT